MNAASVSCVCHLHNYKMLCAIYHVVVLGFVFSFLLELHVADGVVLQHKRIERIFRVSNQSES